MELIQEITSFQILELTKISKQQLKVYNKLKKLLEAK
jgi:hypothetical protein